MSQEELQEMQQEEQVAEQNEQASEKAHEDATDGKKQIKCIKPLIGWSVFGIVAAAAIALAVTMCVIALGK